MTTTTPARATVAARRARVAQLLRQGRSQRDIARTLGVSKDIVHRDVQVLDRVTPKASDQDSTALVAPDTDAVAPPTATAIATPRHDTATATATPRHDTATPAARCLMVPLDEALLADLADLTRPGVAPEAAIRHAVAFLAATYRQAWDAGLYPRHARPVVQRHQYAPYHPAASPPTED
ncbi:hypothetical protein [Streptomyces roseolus]|uniref:hypothetical protein n=1 Tax=Streptomyces roseolus TaxID=67358 RepID=UPI0036938BBA